MSGPTKCGCKICTKFRAKMAPSQLTMAAIRALDKTNMESPTSRRARIAAGVGKNGTIPNAKSEG